MPKFCRIATAKYLRLGRFALVPVLERPQRLTAAHIVQQCPCSRKLTTPVEPSRGASTQAHMKPIAGAHESATSLCSSPCPSGVGLLAIQSRSLRLRLRAAIECWPNGYVEPTRLSFAVSEVIGSGEEDLTLYPMLGSGVRRLVASR